MNSPQLNSPEERTAPHTDAPPRFSQRIIIVAIAVLVLISIGVVTVLITKHKTTADTVKTNATPNSSLTYVGQDSSVSYQLPSGFSAYQCDDLEARYIYNTDVSPLTGKTTARCIYIIPDNVLAAEKPDITGSTEVKSAQLDRVLQQILTAVSVDKVSSSKPAITREVVTSNFTAKYQGIPASALTIVEDTIGSTHIFNGCVSTQFQPILTKGEPLCTLYLGDQNTTISMNSTSVLPPDFRQFIESIDLNAQASQ